MEGPAPRTLASLVRAIAILALPAADQIAWLESLGVDAPVDELALELHDGYLLVPQFMERHWLPPTLIEPLGKLDRLLESMSGPEHAQLWDLESLTTSPRWSEVRRQARQALLLIN